MHKSFDERYAGIALVAFDEAMHNMPDTTGNRFIAMRAALKRVSTLVVDESLRNARDGSATMHMVQNGGG